MLTVFLVLIVIGVLVWLVTTYIPMNAVFQKLIIAVAVIFAVLYLLQAFGVLPLINQPVPRIR